MGLATEADPIAGFFEILAAAGQAAAFNGASASVRFDVANPDGSTQYWHLTIDNGDVTVERRQLRADAVIDIGRQDMAAMVTGRLNAQVAILRGLLICTGSVAAFVLFQRCLPSPPGSTGKVAPISSREVMASRGLA